MLLIASYITLALPSAFIKIPNFKKIAHKAFKISKLLYIYEAICKHSFVYLLCLLGASMRPEHGKIVDLAAILVFMSTKRLSFHFLMSFQL